MSVHETTQQKAAMIISHRKLQALETDGLIVVPKHLLVRMEGTFQLAPTPGVILDQNYTDWYKKIVEPLWIDIIRELRDVYYFTNKIKDRRIAREQIYKEIDDERDRQEDISSWEPETFITEFFYRS